MNEVFRRRSHYQGAILLLFLAFVLPLHAGFTEDFDKAKAKGDKAVEKVQTQYATSEVGNPDYYIKLANYWFHESQEINVSAKAPGNDDYVVKDKKTGKTMGSISRAGEANPALALKAPALLAEASKRFPTRLDILLGHAYVLQGEERVMECAQVMIGLVDSWKFAPDAFSSNEERSISGQAAGEKIMMAGYSRAAAIYKSDVKDAPEACRKLCVVLADTFTKDPRPLNVLAALAFHAGDDAGGIGWLEKAHAADPTDFLVVHNLAEQNLEIGNKKKALEYAQLIIDSKEAGADEYRDDAKNIAEQAKAK